jgi:hypothetical protein
MLLVFLIGCLLFFHLCNLVVTRIRKGRLITRRRDWDEVKVFALLKL